MNVCKLCSDSFDSIASLHKHVSKRHKISPKDYDIEHEFGGKPPLCACGCGEEVNWSKGRPKKFVHTHQTRVPEIRQMMIKSGRDAASDPAKRKKNSDAQKRLWEESPSWREASLKKLKHARETSPIGTRELYDDPKFRERMSEKQFEFWKSESGDKLRAYMKTSEFRKTMSDAMSIALADPSIKKKYSEHAAKMIEDGVIGPNKSKRSSCVNQHTNLTEYFHSTWERLFFDQMELMGTPVTKNHGVRLIYVKPDGSTHTYIPDFVTLTGDVMYEVKGRMTNVDEIKFESAREFCRLHGMTFTVVSRENFVNVYV